MRYNNRTFFKLSLLSIVLLTSCYNLSEVYVNNFEPEYNSLEPVDFINSTDTIFLVGDAWWEFDLSQVEEYYGFEFKFDDTVLESGEYKLDYYRFNSYDYSDGYHILTLNIYKASGSGTLAEKTGYESLVFTMSKVLYIGNNYDLPKPIIENFEVIDGELYVNLEPYSGLALNTLGIAFDGRHLDINDPNSTHILLEGYYGGTVNLELWYYAFENRLYSVTTTTYTFDASYKFEKNGNQIVFTWQKIPFNNCKNINLKVKDLLTAQETILVESKDKYQLEVDLNFSFPHLYEINVDLENLSGELKRNKTISNYARDRMIGNISFQPYQVVNKDHVIIYWSDYSIANQGFFTAELVKITNTPENLEDSLTSIKTVKNVVFSEDFNALYQLNGLMINKYQPQTLDFIDQINIGQIIDTLQSVDMIFAANNNLVAFYFNESTIAVLNWESKKVEHTIAMGDSNCGHKYEEIFYLTSSGRNLIRASYWRSSIAGYEDISGTDYPTTQCFRKSRVLTNDDEIYFDQEQNSYFTRQSRAGSFSQNFIESFSVEPYINGNLLYVYGDDNLLRVHDVLSNSVIKEFQVKRFEREEAVVWSVPHYNENVLGYKKSGYLFIKEF